MTSSTFTKWLSTANHDTRLGHAVLYSMFGCGLLLFALPAYSDLKFWWHGQSVQGRVTTAPVEASNPPKFGPKYTVRYEYSAADGKAHQGEGKVPRATDCRIGDSIEVLYLRNDAAQSRPRANVRFMPPLIIACLGLVIVVISVGYGVRAISRVNQQVLAHQQVAEAGSDVA